MVRLAISLSCVSRTPKSRLFLRNLLVQFARFKTRTVAVASCSSFRYFQKSDLGWLGESRTAAQNGCKGSPEKLEEKKKRKERKKGREGKKARKAEEEETDLMTNTWNRITHCSCKVLSAFGQSSIQFPMPEGWACTDFPPLPRSSRPCLHHLSGDLETKWISRSHGKGSAKTLSSWDVRLSQSFLPSKSKRESPSFQPFWLFPPTFFFFFLMWWNINSHNLIFRVLCPFTNIAKILTQGFSANSDLIFLSSNPNEREKRSIFYKYFSLTF